MTAATKSRAMQNEIIDYYWSYRSHYCYLSIDRVLEIEKNYPIHINLRPVYPIAIRNPEFFANIPKDGPNRWAYIVHDTERTAKRLGIPFGWPDPDPVVMDMQSFNIAAEQPYIYRLTRLGVEANRQGCGLEFTSALSHLIFGGKKGWNKDDVLAKAVAEIGLNLNEMDQKISDAPESYDDEINANDTALADAGHWGVPTLVVRGEPFFGQDRITDFIWRLENLGTNKTSTD